jgi:hypothetical protein
MYQRLKDDSHYEEEPKYETNDLIDYYKQLTVDQTYP